MTDQPVKDIIDGTANRSRQQRTASGASSSQAESKSAPPKTREGEQVISTGDPNISSPRGEYHPDWSGSPDQTIALETSRIRGPNEAFNPSFVVVPIVPTRSGQERSRRDDSKHGSDEPSNSHDGENNHGSQGHNEKKNPPSKDGKNAPEHSEKKDKGRQGWWSRGSSLVHGVLLPGVVALVCGVVGAWGYSHFFGSQKSGEHKSAGKDSDSDSGSDSSKDSSSGKGPDTSKNSDPGKTSTSSKKDSSSEHLLAAQSAWLDAVKELHDSKTAEKDARRSEEESQAVLNFLKRTLLSAGSSENNSLQDAFWNRTPGKDLTLRKALDATESQVKEAFPERPRAEALVREMLGQAYLSLGEPKLAVKQLERAFALRKVTEGIGQPETAACRNQLAVAYRMAGQPTEGARLFDHDTDSHSNASALAISGATLLMEKQPVEAELKLRESLRLSERTKPTAWSTFETKSMLGEALAEQHQFDKAEPFLVAGYEGLKQQEATLPARDKFRVAAARERLVKLYRDWGKPTEASKWEKESQALNTNLPQGIGTNSLASPLTPPR